MEGVDAEFPSGDSLSSSFRRSSAVRRMLVVANKVGGESEVDGTHGADG